MGNEDNSADIAYEGSSTDSEYEDNITNIPNEDDSTKITESNNPPNLTESYHPTMCSDHGKLEIIKNGISKCHCDTGYSGESCNKSLFF